MMDSVENRERAKWQERFSRPGFWAGNEPAEFLRELLPLLPRAGTALEIAMGEGRNAVFLAAQGWRVLGLDLVPAALAKAEGLAAAIGVRTWRIEKKAPARPPAPGLLMGCVDLGHEPLPAGEFDLVLCINFLLRPLLPQMERAVGPGGHLIYETYTTEQLRFDGGPRSPNYLLNSGELRAAFPSLETVFYRECTAEKGIASLFARRPL